MDRTKLLLVFTFLALSPAAFAQRESWRPATAQEWKRPPVVEWQRTLDDALAVSTATKRPVLICVNMDGEAASENYAGVRYRDPAFAKLTAGYVPVIASPDRHTPRDFDAQGNRVPCPRFGRVVCSEHIQIEPALFDRYFKKNRVAPRHMGLTAEGKILFDCFLNMDISPVLKALQEHAAVGLTLAAGGSPEAWLRVRDAGDRVKLEDAYRAGDVNAQKALLEAAAKAKKTEPFDLIRLGLRDADAETRAVARRALAATATVNAVALLSDAMRQTKDAGERKVLSDALLTLSKGDLRAKRAVALARALDAKSTVVDLDAWKTALSKPGNTLTPGSDPDALERQIEQLGSQVKASKSDGKAALDLARATLAFAELRMAARKDPTLLFDDVKHALDQAKERGQSGPELALLQARLLLHRGEGEPAGPLAVSALPLGLTHAMSQDAMWTLWIVGRAARARIAKAQGEERDWPSEWLTDGHAAYSVLALHPMSSDLQACEHYDLLVFTGAPEAAYATLDGAVKRFPDSAPLHERFRAAVLELHGIDALEKAYEKERVARPNDAALSWFSGYASMVTAEYLKRGGKELDAQQAYDRAIQHFEASQKGNATYQETANYYIAMALAGKARLALDDLKLDAATTDLCAALDRSPAILEVEDGLGRTPHATARSLRWALDEGKRADLREKLEAALEAIDPDLASRPAK